MSAGFTEVTDRWGNRTYHLDDENLDLRSVTTWISKGTPKPALLNWKAKVTAEAAIDDYEIVGHMLAQGDPDNPASMRAARDKAIDHVKGASFRVGKQATDLGSKVHDIVEAILSDWPIPEHMPEAKPYIDAIRMFIDDWQPVLVRSEFPVFHRLYGYAGRCDAHLRFPLLDDQEAFVDWKTTKPNDRGHGIYPEAAMQLSAYRHGEFLITDNGERIPIPKVDTCYGINFRPGKYFVIPLRTGADTFRAFRAVQEVGIFLDGLRGDAVGDQLAPPLRQGVLA